jgi:hypothetical protein
MIGQLENELRSIKNVLPIFTNVNIVR